MMLVLMLMCVHDVLFAFVMFMRYVVVVGFAI